MKKKLIMLMGLILILGFTACDGPKEEKKEITVYSSFEEDYISDYIVEFNKIYPDIKVNLIRDSSGIIAAKVEAEKENPQADVLWGVAATGLLQYSDLYEGFDYDVNNIDNKFYDTKSIKPTWVGVSAWMTAFTYNTVEGEKLDLEVPKSYEDLLDSSYKGQMIMPNPASSGTGFLTVSAWIQMMGEKKAWAYMDKLNENMNMYVHSGSAPTKMAAQGETVIGIGMGFESLTQEKNGAPIKTIFPIDGSGWEEEIVALIKKDNIKPEAKEFVKWAISKEAMKEYTKHRGFVTNKTVKSNLFGYPKDVVGQMIKNDLEWAAKNRDRILKEWENRYGKK
ncbi:MAG: putative 2-aminoethylphosphonate ABC transporter substrate-binding protein [Psychrilyobacter sp.]|uniref:putative 2-aminoethylphosphonate ABC transporter substrate-binding protein n=1 Tax=Psychrilyobacter sp. TaxID=2586924 RepID=UPI003C71D9F7